MFEAQGSIPSPLYLSHYLKSKNRAEDFLKYPNQLPLDFFMESQEHPSIGLLFIFLLPSKVRLKNDEPRIFSDAFYNFSNG